MLWRGCFCGEDEGENQDEDEDENGGLNMEYDGGSWASTMMGTSISPV